MKRELIADAPLLLALFLAPLTGGRLDPAAGTGFAALAWTALLLRYLVPGAGRPRRPRGAPLVLAFCAVALLAAGFAVTPGAAVLQCAVWTGGAAAFWASALSSAAGGSGRLLCALLAGALIAGASSLREYVEHFRAGDPGWRTFFTFSNPNFLAGYLAPALLLALGAASFLPSGFKPATWTLALSLVGASLAGGLAVTGSRGGLLAAGAGVVVLLGLLVLLRARLTTPDRIRLAAVALAAISVAVALSGVVRRRQSEEYRLLPPELGQLTESSAGESGRFRLLTWQGALGMGLARPLVGWGPGSFETSFEPFAHAGFTRHAHNSYLQLFAEAGATAPMVWTLAALWIGWVSARSVLVGPPGPPGWQPAVLGALAATSVHNVFDSLLYVPACALLFWCLLGVLAAPEPAPAADAPAPAKRRRRGAGARASGADGRSLGPACACGAAAGINLLLLSGCLALAEGRALVAKGQWSAALDSLRLAEALLPWDHRVADEQRRACRGLGQWEQAIESGLRAIRLAPRRAAGYDFVAVLRNFLERRDMAIQTYEIGLEHTPRNVTLLSSSADLLFREGRREEALERYRRLVEVEESPIGRVRALGELRDHRFARARVALAAALDQRGETAQAHEQRLKAAVLLAERRRLFDGSPATYILTGGWDARTERDLRTEEQALWNVVRRYFSEHGDSVRAQRCAEMLDDLAKSRPRLEEHIRALGRATSGDD